MQKSLTIVKSKITTTFLALLFSAVTLFLPVFATQSPVVHAATEADGGGFVPCGNTANNPCNVSHLFKAFIIIVNYLIDLAGFVAVAAIVYAALLMVTSQGEGRLTEAKKRLSGAVFGLLIVMAAFVLINALFAGSLSVGLKNGGQILSNPRAYINGK